MDLSDYGRPAARTLVQVLIPTPISSVHVTLGFLGAGLLSAYLLSTGHEIGAALALMAKNVLDAADGELARARGRPSSAGRYLDSVADFVVNLVLSVVLFTVTSGPAWLLAAAFLGLQFQGTVFNYYYLLQRRACGGETTSRVDEFAAPHVFPYERARTVRVLHLCYLVCYGAFDRAMVFADGRADRVAPLPNWFMTLVSTTGLGFQLLLMALFLVTGRVGLILPFFAAYTAWAIAIVLVRKLVVGGPARAGT